MIIDIVSDLHGAFPLLHGGDLLLLGGDYTARDRFEEYELFFRWLKRQKYRKKIFIAGNHDNLAMSQFDWGDDAEYLHDSGTEFEGLKIWGSPWTYGFPGINPKCAAYTLNSDSRLAEKWDLIPEDTQILMTHSPPYTWGDEIDRDHVDIRGNNHPFKENVGSKSLLAWIAKHPKHLKLHCFGHVHEGYGKWEKGDADAPDQPIMVNASHMDVRYRAVNKPIRVQL